MIQSNRGTKLDADLRRLIAQSQQPDPRFGPTHKKRVIIQIHAAADREQMDKFLEENDIQRTRRESLLKDPSSIFTAICAIEKLEMLSQHPDITYIQ